MKVYLASCIDNKVLIEVLAHDLIQSNIEVVGNWWDSSVELLDDIRVIAKTDFGGIDQADIVIGLYPYGFGTVSELGYALGKGKTVLYVRPTGMESEHPLPVGMLQPENILTSWNKVKSRLKDYE